MIPHSAKDKWTINVFALWLLKKLLVLQSSRSRNLSETRQTRWPPLHSQLPGPTLFSESLAFKMLWIFIVSNGFLDSGFLWAHCSKHVTSLVCLKHNSKCVFLVSFCTVFVYNKSTREDFHPENLSSMLFGTSALLQHSRMKLHSKFSYCFRQVL